MKNYFNVLTVLPFRQQMLGKGEICNPPHDLCKSSRPTLSNSKIFVPTLRQFMYPLQRTDRFRDQSTGCTAFRRPELPLWGSKLFYISDKISTVPTVKHRPSAWVKIL